MKNAVILFLSITVPIFVFGQNDEFLNYTFGEDVRDIAFHIDIAWIATTGGLVKHHTVTEDSEYLNRSNDGIPLNKINAIKVSTDGTIYAATDIGLAIKDYQGWHLKNPPYDGNPSHYRIAFWDIELDLSGNMWLLAHGGNLWKYDGTNWTAYDEESLFGNDVYKLRISPEGDLWVSTIRWDFRIYQFDGNNATEITLPVDETDQITDWTFAPNGELWFLYKSHILGKPSGTSWELEETNHFGTALKVKENGELWIGFHHRDESGNWKSLLQWNTELRQIVLDENGDAWFCRETGLYRAVDNQLKKVQTSNSNVSGNTVVELVVSGDQNIYAGFGDYVWMWPNHASDINLYSSGYWHSYDLPPHLTDMDIDQSGNLWGAKENYIVHFDGYQWVQHENTAWYGGYIEALGTSPINNDVWIGGSNGLAKFSNGQFEFFQSPEEFSFVRIIKVGADGKIWFTAYSIDFLLGVYDNGEWLFLNHEDMNLPNYALTTACIEIAPNGDIWVGTDGGLAKFDGIEWQSWTYGTAPVNMILNVSSIAFDSKGATWIGYYKNTCFYPDTHLGLTKIENDEWTTWWYESTGLPYPNITALAVDAYDNIWIGLEKGGIAVFNEEEVYVGTDEANILEPTLFKIYPNPAKDLIYIQSLTDEHFEQIEILNASGRILKSYKANYSKNINYSISELPSGLYFLKIKTPKGFSTKKIIKQ